MLNEYMSTKEAADFLGYDADYICYLCIHDKLPGARKFGKSWAIPEKAVREYKPGLQGFAAVKERKNAEMNSWIELARQTTTGRKRSENHSAVNSPAMSANQSGHVKRKDLDK